MDRDPSRLRPVCQAVHLRLPVLCNSYPVYSPRKHAGFNPLSYHCALPHTGFDPWCMQHGVEGNHYCSSHVTSDASDVDSILGTAGCEIYFLRCASQRQLSALNICNKDDFRP